MVTLFRHHFHVISIVQALFEALLFFGVVYFVIELQSGGNSPALLPALVFAVLMLTANAAFGLYRADVPQTLSSVVPRLLCAVGIAIIVAYAGLVNFYPALWVLDDALLAGALTGLAGTLILRTTIVPSVTSNLARHRVLVLGTGKRASAVADALGGSPFKSIDVVGFLAPLSKEDPMVPANRILIDRRPISELVERLGVSEIIVAVEEQRGGALPMDELLQCRLDGIQVSDLADFLERVRGVVPLGSFKASWLIYGDGFRQGRVRTWVKRAFDVVVSATLLALTAPLMLLAALAVKLESHGPVIYRQQRVGRAGHPFDVLKFRSMVANAERDGRPQWAAANDVRITRIGRIMRRTRIDELPQLINVLRGEMSFVGPRPERPYFVEQLSESIPFYGLRHSVQPGITGWAQVRYTYSASVEDAAKKLEYDLYYVKNHSLFLDIVILLETVRVVLFGEGAR